jgi:hypothetical protein
MKSAIAFFMCLFCLSTQGQKLDENSIYFVGRGTLSKKELIGDRFNLIDKELTHLGLGLVTNDTLYVYNVSSDKKQNNSSLIVEKIADFKNVNDIFYFGIWQYKCSKKDVEKVRNEIAAISKQAITFDRKFALADDNKLYCSEFVFKIASCLEGLYFKPTVKELNKIEKQILGVEDLTYIPVDFFLSDTRITKLQSEYLKLN